jgi:hypothetical protein
VTGDVCANATPDSTAVATNTALMVDFMVLSLYLVLEP